MAVDAMPAPSFGNRISTYFYVRPRLLLALFLLPPLLWLGVVYLGSLFALLAQSFFQLDDFTGQVVGNLGDYGLKSPFADDGIGISGGFIRGSARRCGSRASTRRSRR